MRWLEVIKVRSAGKDVPSLETFLQSLNGVRQEGLIEITCYRHATLETDLSVHLLWEVPQIETQGSPLALRLVQAIDAFGLVDHSLWLAQAPK
jgi:hypothetical protein